MIKNQIFTLLMIVAAALSSCNNDNKLKEEKLNDEVMAVHNEIMPKMAEVNRLKRQLKSYKETVSDENVALKDSVINAILLLSKSEDLMNDWMANYKYPNPDAKHEELINYLSGQKDSIKLVSDNMFMSMAVAQGFLKNMPDSIKGESKDAPKMEEHSHH